MTPHLPEVNEHPRSVRAAVAALRGKGFAVCKPDPVEKKPTYRGWSTRSLGAEDFTDGDQVGALGGPLSNGGKPGHSTVIVDLDSPEAVQLADEFLPPTGMCEGRAGKPRAHRYYLVPHGSIPNWARSAAEQASLAAIEACGHPGPFLKRFQNRYTGKGVLDFLGTGGQVVCPPAIWASKDGATTERREWDGGSPGEPAIVDFLELWTTVCDLADAAGAAIPNVVPSEPRDRSRAVTTPIIDRAKRYLAKCEPAIDRCGGHSTLFKVTRAMVWGFDLEPEQAYGILATEYNPRCAPPWSERELRHKISHADRVPFHKPRGWLRDAPRPGSSPTAAIVRHNDGRSRSTETEPEPELIPNDAPENPHRLAKGYLDSVTPPDSPRLLRFWRSEFHLYDDGHYRPAPDDDLRARLTQYVRGEFVRLNALAVAACAGRKDDKGNELKPPTVRPVTSRLVSDTLQALRGLCLLPAAVEAPAWIDGATGPDPIGLLPVRNGILDLAALADGLPDCLLSSSPLFFTPTAAPFDFAPDAPEPQEWLKFLREVWPDDPESVGALREWFGLLLTPDTRYQKILFVVGPKRSGKGTIIRMLRELVGHMNVAGPTLGSLSLNFGLAPLIGKSVAIVSDARLSGRADAAVITERLLSISGEDAITIDRKHRDSLTLKLSARFVIVSNELPRLGDASGALPSRLIVLRTTRSWYGKEDHKLFDRLRAELPGVLLWAVEGWRRLRDRGRLLQPTSGAEQLQEMEDIASPVGAFVRERCHVATGERVEVDQLYGEWRAWCEQRGRKEPGHQETFGRDLRAAVPSVSKSRPRTAKGRIYFYQGIRIRLDGDPESLPDGHGDHLDHPDGQFASVNLGPGGLSDHDMHALLKSTPLTPSRPVDAASTGPHGPPGPEDQPPARVRFESDDRTHDRRS